MKIALSGKGGVGKTTIAGILAILFARDGKNVITVDADPSSNLAYTLGFSKEEIEKIVPLAEMQELIEERTEAKKGYGTLFKLNPKVDDLPEKFVLKSKDGVRLLVLGSAKSGGEGCFCPESALLKRLIKHLISKEEILIMDMEAGLEHLTRATTENLDLLIIVIDTSLKSVDVAKKINKLAKEIKIKNVVSVLNKGDEKIAENFKNELSKEGIGLIGFIPFDEEVVSADLNGISPINAKKMIEGVKKIREKVEKNIV